MSETHRSLLHPAVTLKSSPLPLKRHSELLGVTFDTHLFFAQHVIALKKDS